MATDRRSGSQTVVALLRGINVGGRNALSMASLRSMAAELGFAPVSTYLQSGNLIVGAPQGRTGPMAAALETAIGDALGREVRVLIRSDQELDELVAGNPFLAGPADAAGLHVTFLAEQPDPVRVAALPPAAGGDEYALATRAIYLRCPSGYGRTALHNAFWERRLGVAATTRNWRTVSALARLAAETSTA